MKPNRAQVRIIPYKSQPVHYKRVFKTLLSKALTDRQYPTDEILALDDFPQIIEAMYIFKQLHGDLEIPNKYEIPAESPWPSSLHGFRLGRRLERILNSDDFFKYYPEKVREMVKLGFDPKLESLLDDWNLILKSMRLFKSIYGNVSISSKFIVPNNDERWPRICWGVKLGIRVAAIRSAGRYVKDHPERKVELDELGFQWRIRDHTHKQQVGEDLFQQVFDGLVYYKNNIDEDLIVPPDFTFPEYDENTNNIPIELSGLKLGFYVQSIKSEDKLVFGHADRVQRLNSIGFPWEESSRAAHSKKRFENIYLGMVTYKELYGDLFVPQSFTVPSEAPWDESTWGLKLGARVNAIRTQGTFINSYPERRDRLDKLGFSWELASEVRRKKKLLESIEEAQRNGDPSLSNDSYLAEYTVLKQPKKAKKKTELINEFGLQNKGNEVLDYETELIRAKYQLSGDKIAGLSEPPSSRKQILSYDPSRIFEPISYREIAAEAMGEYMRSREYSSDPDIRHR
eukprot:gene15300-20611_t